MKAGTLPSSKNIYWNLIAVYFILYITAKILFIHSGVDLFSEEAQYWLWSRYPDWSYYSKPPLIAWVNYLTTFVFGDNELIIRYTALGFGLVSLFMMYRLAMLLFDEENIAVFSVIFLSVSPYFVLASTFFTTDTLLIFFWITTGYFLIKAIRKNESVDWILSGLCFGLGMLSKYSMLFFLIALVPLFFKRNYLRYKKGILIFFIIGAFMLTPVIIWNAQHDWVNFKHISNLSSSHKIFSFKNSLVYLSEYIGGVLLINSPFLLILLFRWKAAFKKQSHQKDEILWLTLPVIGTMAVFFTMSVFKRTEVNWGAMSYVSIPLILAYLTHKTFSYNRSIWLSGITFSCILLLLFPLALERAGLAGIPPLKMDSLKRMAGWEELATKVSSLQRDYPDPTLILTDSYHIASEMSFYGRFDNLYCVNNGRRMNQFDIWGGLYEPDNQGLRAFFVTDLTHIPEHGLRFKSIEAHYTFPVKYRGEVVKTYNIFVLNDFTTDSFNYFGKY